MKAPTGKCIIVSAPSGAGKTTIVKHLLDNKSLGLEFSVSATSRARRGDEKQEVDYYFVGVDGFKKHINDNMFIEWEEVYPDQFYGTLKSEIERIWAKGSTVIFDLDVIGGLNLKKYFGENALSIFIKPPSVEALRNRLEKRNTESVEKINMRVNKASQEMSLADKFDKIVLNEDVEIAVDETVSIISEFLKL